MKTAIPFPKCDINPKTGRPFSRHDWEIVQSEVPKVRYRPSRYRYDPAFPFIRWEVEDHEVYGLWPFECVYHTRCSRCGINHPDPPRF